MAAAGWLRGGAAWRSRTQERLEVISVDDSCDIFMRRVLQLCCLGLVGPMAAMKAPPRVHDDPYLRPHFLPRKALRSRNSPSVRSLAEYLWIFYSTGRCVLNARSTYLISEFDHGVSGCIVDDLCFGPTLGMFAVPPLDFRIQNLYADSLLMPMNFPGQRAPQGS